MYWPSHVHVLQVYREIKIKGFTQNSNKGIGPEIDYPFNLDFYVTKPLLPVYPTE